MRGPQRERKNTQRQALRAQPALSAQSFLLGLNSGVLVFPEYVTGLIRWESTDLNKLKQMSFV